MSKVLVDRELLEKWADKLEGADSAGYGWEDLLATEVRGVIAQPAEAEGVRENEFNTNNGDLTELLNIAADMLKGNMEVLERVEDHLAALSVVTAERDDLRLQVEAARSVCTESQGAILGLIAERDQLRDEVERLREAEPLLLSVCDDLMRHENADVRMVTCIELNNWLTKRAAMAAKEE